MRRAYVLAASLAILALAGCSNAGDANKINDLCRPYGGVISSDFHGEIVVCADKIARGF